VTLLEGRGEVEVEGRVTPLEPPDTTYLAAGIIHAFRNAGDTPMSSTCRPPTRWSATPGSEPLGS
jgi:quercetin dioxygenase-like cupin family protein